jgi:hypothetical protein
MPITPLWLFAHRALAPTFHRNPTRLVAHLGAATAQRYLAKMWRWSIDVARSAEPRVRGSVARQPTETTPPVLYGLEAMADGGVHLRLRFRDVLVTGEPYLMSCIVATTYARMFLLEHSELASAYANRPRGVLCESIPGGHRTWGTGLEAWDDKRFEDEIVQILLRAVVPIAASDSTPMELF